MKSAIWQLHFCRRKTRPIPGIAKHNICLAHKSAHVRPRSKSFARQEQTSTRPDVGDRVDELGQKHFCNWIDNFTFWTDKYSIPATAASPTTAHQNAPRPKRMRAISATAATTTARRFQSTHLPRNMLSQSWIMCNLRAKTNLSDKISHFDQRIPICIHPENLGIFNRRHRF